MLRLEIAARHISDVGRVAVDASELDEAIILGANLTGVREPAALETYRTVIGHNVRARFVRDPLASERDDAIVLSRYVT